MTRVKPHHVLLGRLGESWVKAELKRKGYDVTSYGGVHGFDLLVNSRLTIDVKAATLSAGPRNGHAWQFNLQRHNREHVEHLTICLCVASWTRKTIAPKAAFLIPGELTEGKKKIVVTSKSPQDYAGKWAAWRDGWGTVDKLLVGLSVWDDRFGEIPF